MTLCTTKDYLVVIHLLNLSHLLFITTIIFTFTNGNILENFTCTKRSIMLCKINQLSSTAKSCDCSLQATTSEGYDFGGNDLTALHLALR